MAQGRGRVGRVVRDLDQDQRVDRALYVIQHALLAVGLGAMLASHQWPSVWWDVGAFAALALFVIIGAYRHYGQDGE